MTEFLLSQHTIIQTGYLIVMDRFSSIKLFYVYHGIFDK